MRLVILLSILCIAACSDASDGRLDRRALPLGGGAASCQGGAASHLDPLSGNCYMYFAQAQPWMQARAACEAQSGNTHLAIVDSMQEHMLVMDLVAGAFAFGGWLDATDISGEWGWYTTGERVSFDGWHGVQPDGTGAENCMIVEPIPGGWSDRPCSFNAQGYVCEREALGGGADAGPEPDGCGAGDDNAIDPRTGNCYMLFRNTTLWFDARSRCEGLGDGAHLVTVFDAQENEFLAERWGGEQSRIWLGANREDNGGDWTWVTGEAMDYDDWRSDEPDFDDLCAAADYPNPMNGTWRGNPCFWDNEYICEREAADLPADAGPNGDGGTGNPFDPSDPTSLYDCTISPGARSHPTSLLFWTLLGLLWLARRRVRAR